MARRARGTLGGAGGWLAKQAVKLGVALRPRAKHAAVFGVCPAHLSDELLASMGFLDRTMFIEHVEALSRRGPKPRKSVTLPREKRPPGILRVVARRCPKCGGRVAMCGTCSGWGWGLTMFTRRPREPKPKVTPSPVVSAEAPR